MLDIPIMNKSTRNWIIFFIVLFVLLLLTYLEKIPLHIGIPASVVYLGSGSILLSHYNNITYS